MFRLATTLFSLISTTLMGSFIVVVLVMGYDTLLPILIAAAVGFVVALPISWFVAKQIYENA
ncbi:CTP synthetase [Donghicola sp. XS_ASV15]|uniref:CTP synthetase n=1 Tax=Donghicola sp. XS_ASV15 TaxID=3241295 RepID=UPI003515D767